MDGLQEFDFIHLTSVDIMFHAKIANESCFVTWKTETEGEEKSVIYTKDMVKEYIEKGLWIVRKGGLNNEKC